MKIVKSYFLPVLITLSALAVSTSAAFYSVSGLSKLFAGAQTEVIIMASALELSKLVTASLLYQYWDKLNKLLRTYLLVATTVLILITSLGIYGFLSAAYQETYSSLLVTENKEQFLDQKIQFYQEDLARYDTELSTISANIAILSTTRADQIQIRDTTSNTGYRTAVSTAGLKLAQKRIDEEEKNRSNIVEKRQVVIDSIQAFKLRQLDLRNNSDQAGELGPLKYLSGLTGKPMDIIINWLLLVIIFVFDPLAVSMVVAANFAFKQVNINLKIEPIMFEKKSKEVKEKVEEQLVQNPSVLDLEVEHFEEVSPEVDEEALKAEEANTSTEEQEDNQPSEKEVEGKPYAVRVLQKGPSKWRVLFSDGEEKWVSKNDVLIK